MTSPRILLIIGGGIAAYKTPELVRSLRANGFAVRPLLTAAAAQFVSPLALASVAGDKVYQNLFDLNEEAEMGHIQLSRDADMVLVAPATADLIGKAAQGLANDLASATLLATDKPVMIAPAMNVRMWHHPAMQRNMRQLAADGVAIIGPDAGDMACGEYGRGRMSEPAAIADALVQYFRGQNAALAGRKVLITAGPTYEPIDPIRYIANRSSGKQGYALARALADLGADVHLISGPTHLPPPPHVQCTRIETAQSMWKACEAALPCDVAICAAAVADWRPDMPAAQKIKKQNGGLAAIKLVANPDILAALAAHKARPPLLIGFAAETENLTANAQAKRAHKGCDWMIANDVSLTSGIQGGVMGADENRIQIITDTDIICWEAMPKDEVAQKLAAKIAETLTASKS